MINGFTDFYKERHSNTFKVIRFTVKMNEYKNLMYITYIYTLWIICRKNKLSTDESVVPYNEVKPQLIRLTLKIMKWIGLDFLLTTRWIQNKIIINFVSLLIQYYSIKLYINYSLPISILLHEFNNNIYFRGNDWAKYSFALKLKLIIFFNIRRLYIVVIVSTRDLLLYKWLDIEIESMM